MVLGTPGVPTGVVVAASAGQLSVSFVPPANLGAAGIPPDVMYRAVCSSSDGGTLRWAQATASPITVLNPTAGNTYSCRVAAINPVGLGPSLWSTPVLAL